MASASMAVPLVTCASHNNKLVKKPINPLLPNKSLVVVVKSKSKSRIRFEVQSSLKEKAITGLTAAALTASMVVPEVAEAAGSGISPSLNNFLLSIAAGGVVLAAIVGAVIGVSNFDPVKRS